MYAREREVWRVEVDGVGLHMLVCDGCLLVLLVYSCSDRGSKLAAVEALDQLCAVYGNPISWCH